nr:mitochondrial import inner membrane translocase subunit tim50 [Quercus suber]
MDTEDRVINRRLKEAPVSSCNDCLDRKRVDLTHKDLSKLNRNPAKILYLSGHALEGCLQHENCVPIKPWKKNDADDTALLDFIPFLEFVARTSPSDIRQVLASYQGCEIPSEFIRRSKDYQR